MYIVFRAHFHLSRISLSLGILIAIHMLIGIHLNLQEHYKKMMELVEMARHTYSSLVKSSIDTSDGQLSIDTSGTSAELHPELSESSAGSTADESEDQIITQRTESQHYALNTTAHEFVPYSLNVNAAVFTPTLSLEC